MLVAQGIAPAAGRNQRWLSDEAGKGSSDRRVDGIAARSQHGGACLSRLRMPRGNDPFHTGASATNF